SANALPTDVDRARRRDVHGLGALAARAADDLVSEVTEARGLKDDLRQVAEREPTELLLEVVDDVVERELAGVEQRRELIFETLVNAGDRLVRHGGQVDRLLLDLEEAALQAIHRFGAAAEHVDRGFKPKTQVLAHGQAEARGRSVNV